MVEIPLPDPPLTAGGLVLRPFTDGDVPAVVAALEDGDVSRWTALIPWPYTEDDARAWIGSHGARRADGTGLNLAITEGGAPLGAIGLNVDWGANDAVLGYWVARPARGRGLATGALRLVCDWARADLRLNTLKLTTMKGNGASERVATKAGFTAVRVIEDCDLGTKRATVTQWELGPSDTITP